MLWCDVCQGLNSDWSLLLLTCRMASCAFCEWLPHDSHLLSHSTFLYWSLGTVEAICFHRLSVNNFQIRQTCRKIFEGKKTITMNVFITWQTRARTEKKNSLCNSTITVYVNLNRWSWSWEQPACMINNRSVQSLERSQAASVVFAWHVCPEVWTLQLCMWSAGRIYLAAHSSTIPLPTVSVCSITKKQHLFKTLQI